MAKLKKRADGRYQRKVTLSTGKAKIVYGRTLAELNAAEDALRAEDRQGLAVGDHTLVGDWAKIWLDTYKKDLRAATVSMYRWAYNVHIMPTLGSMELREVKPVHVRQVMAAVADKSDSTQRKVLVTMRQIFETARQNHLVVSNPVDGVKTTPHTFPEKRKYLTPAEAQALMQAVTEPRARAFCGLCLYCGLRREEALGLQWDDIDGDKLTINRAVTFLNNQQDAVQELKTKAAHRVVPIPAPLREILGDTPHLSRYVVPAAGGGDMTKSAFRRMWEEYVQRCFPLPLRPHMLRHTYATTLYRAGVDLRTAQKLLGHSSIQMTANIYTHLEAEDSMQAVGRLNQYFEAAG